MVWEKLFKLPRTAVISVGGLLFLAGLVAAFCPCCHAEGGYRPQGGSYGGELILATISDPKSFNPILAKEIPIATDGAMISAILQTLSFFFFK